MSDADMRIHIHMHMHMHIRLYKHTHMHMCIHIRTRALWRRTVTNDQRPVRRKRTPRFDTPVTMLETHVLLRMHVRDGGHCVIDYKL